MRSCAHWLSWRIGMDLRTAREQLRVARALAGLPLITAEFTAGRLSYSKVRAITRIATPDTEHTLLELALAGTAAHVEQVVALTRRCGTQAAAAAAQRFLRWEWAEDGSLLLRARLPAEQGALLLAALQALTEPPDGPAEHPQPAPEHGSAELSDVDPEPETEPGPPPNWQAEQAKRPQRQLSTRPGRRLTGLPRGEPTRWPPWPRPRWTPPQLLHSSRSQTGTRSWCTCTLARAAPSSRAAPCCRPAPPSGSPAPPESRP